MSEPFWKGKTREELEGSRVKVTYDCGTIIIGRMTPDGDIPIYGGQENAVISSDDILFLPSECESVELLDDQRYERIDDIDDLQEGDLIVTDYDNRYLLTGGVTMNSLLVESLEPTERIDHGHSRLTIPRTYFAYGLRRKPQLPDKPGLWVDKDGDVWLMMTEMMRRISIHGKWCCCDAVEIAECSSRAPFRPYKPEENE